MRATQALAALPWNDAGPHAPGATGMPRPIRRGQGSALCAPAAGAFSLARLSRSICAAPILAPDLSFTGYAAGQRFGSMVYNTVHSTVMPACRLGLSLASGGAFMVGVAATSAAPIGFDRMLGYGLEDPIGFADTRLGRIGPAHVTA